MADDCVCRWTRPLVPGLHRAAVLALDYSTHAGLYTAITRAIRTELCDTCNSSGDVVDDKGRSVPCTHPGVHTGWDEAPATEPAPEPLEQDDLLSVLPEVER